MLPAMDPDPAILLLMEGPWWARLLLWLAGLPVTIARRPILLFLVTLAFVLSAVLLLALSGLVFRGWWQGFCLELGVGLFIAGIVDVAILGALHGLIEGNGGTQ